MKDKPIIFSTPMVQAILDGRKTQTRMIVKEQPDHITGDMLDQNRFYAADNGDFAGDPDREIISPYQVGQKLWVRETWCYGKVIPVDNPDGFIVEQCEKCDDFLPYEAMIRENIGIEEVKWKPSIFMPKKYARIWLEVTNVRIEELQDITGSDCFSEGIQLSGMVPASLTYQWNKAKEEFKNLWDSINKNHGYGWNANPWVWVIEFKKIKG